MEQKQELWYVGLTFEGENSETVGIFSTREKALAACKFSNYFLAPLTMDAEAPAQTVEWPGLVYPLVEGPDDPR